MNVSLLSQGTVQGSSLPADWKKACLEFIASAPYAPSAGSFLTDVENVESPRTGEDCYVALLLAHAKERAMGFVLLRVAFGDADIEYVVVPESMRRKGIASGLLRAAQEFAEARGVTRLLLEVGESNTAARALYEGFGFRQVGCRKKYYAGTENALILELALPSPA